MTFKKTFEDSAGGVSDHGSLTGLTDDDHPQYLTQAEADALYKALGYIPSWAEITGKPTTFPPSAHKTSHATGEADALAASDIGAAPGSHVGSTDGHPLATTTLAGFQSAADKARLDGVRPNNAYADLSLSANQTGIAHATWTPIYWNMEAADPRNWHSNTTSPELITLDSTGFYLITVYQRWASPNTSGARFIRVKVNGAGGPLFEDSASAATDSIGRITVARQFAVSASDFLVVEVNQTSGSILDLHSVTSMGIARIL